MFTKGLVIGGECVGKTAILNLFEQAESIIKACYFYRPSKGITFTTFNLANDVELRLWDVGSGSNHLLESDGLIRGTDLLICVYDRYNFESIIQLNTCLSSFDSVFLSSMPAFLVITTDFAASSINIDKPYDARCLASDYPALKHISQATFCDISFMQPYLKIGCVTQCFDTIKRLASEINFQKTRANLIKHLLDYSGWHGIPENKKQLLSFRFFPCGRQMEVQQIARQLQKNIISIDQALDDLSKLALPSNSPLSKHLNANPTFQLSRVEV